MTTPPVTTRIEEVFLEDHLHSLSKLVNAHFAWLPTQVPFLRVVTGAQGSIHLRAFGLELIHLAPEIHSRVDTLEVLALPIAGGLLYRPGGTMQFERIRTNTGASTLRVALVDYRPRLPLWLYNKTQLVLHNWLTHRFALGVVRGRIDVSPPDRPLPLP